MYLTYLSTVFFYFPGARSCIAFTACPDTDRSEAPPTAAASDLRPSPAASCPSPVDISVLFFLCSFFYLHSSSAAGLEEALLSCGARCMQRPLLGRGAIEGLLIIRNFFNLYSCKQAPGGAGQGLEALPLPRLAGTGDLSYGLEIKFVNADHKILIRRGSLIDINMVSN